MAETSEAFRVGLLGHGTVGGAFAALLEERAGAVAATTGLRPELSRRADPLARATSRRSSRAPTSSSS